jgi:hypothetical protein
MKILTFMRDHRLRSISDGPTRPLLGVLDSQILHQAPRRGIYIAGQVTDFCVRNLLKPAERKSR